MKQATICAIATPAGGALGIVRISGPEAIAMADRLLRLPHGRLADRRGGTLAFGRVVGANGETIDEVVASLWRAPHSYTGEDSVELTCHGSRYILERVVHELLAVGCRMAGPGEYTERAFANGKMDLAQAEAVADLIAARSAAMHRQALRQMRGSFSSQLAELRQQLLKLTSLLELELDFSDHEDLEFANRDELLQLAGQIENVIARLRQSFALGRAMKEGIAVAIAGATNAGKSTLLNRLLGEERALVSDVPGTTRDSIEATLSLGGYLFRFIDTAGIRATGDKVEQMGIDRSFDQIERATVVLWVVDLTDPQSAKTSRAELQPRLKGKHVVIVLNKSDKATAKEHEETLSALASLPYAQLEIAAKENIGVEKLLSHLPTLIGLPDVDSDETIVVNLRHYEALGHAGESIHRAIEGLENNLSGELVAQDLRQCADELAEITGQKITSSEILQTVFKHFCVGK